MNLDFFDKFSDPAMKKPGGQGALLAGVTLGMVAIGQAADDNVDSTPMFKQISFGRMKSRDVKRLLARVPDLCRAYDIKYKDLICRLAGYASELLLMDNANDMGIDGNFAFATGFVNAREYFWTIYGKTANSQGEDTRITKE